MSNILADSKLLIYGVDVNKKSLEVIFPSLLSNIESMKLANFRLYSVVRVVDKVRLNFISRGVIADIYVMRDIEDSLKRLPLKVDYVFDIDEEPGERLPEIRVLIEFTPIVWKIYEWSKRPLVEVSDGRIKANKVALGTETYKALLNELKVLEMPHKEVNMLFGLPVCVDDNEFAQLMLTNKQ